MLKIENDFFSYGGWGPGEDYGHTGVDPPRYNLNADYGFDFTGTMDKPR